MFDCIWVSSTSQPVTISPISARAKDEPKARFGKSAGKIIGAIVSAPISRIVVIIIMVTRGRSIVTVVIISRPVIIVMASGVPRPVTSISAVVFIIMTAVAGCTGIPGVMITPAGQGQPGSEQDHYGKH
jgi:hypothetical protein